MRYVRGNERVQLSKLLNISTDEELLNGKDEADISRLENWPIHRESQYNEASVYNGD
jgi:hypothetical protein